MAKRPKSKNILFLCAHNQSRSVTAEGLLMGEKGYRVKSRALWRGMERRVSKWDGQWADEVYVMMPGMVPVAVEAGIPEKKVKSLWIPDQYFACEPRLILELRSQLAVYGIKTTKPVTQAESDCETVHARKMGFTFGKLNWDWEFGTGLPITKESFEEEPVSGHVSRPREKWDWETAPAGNFDYVPYRKPTQQQLSVKPEEPERFSGAGYFPLAHIKEGEKRKREAEESEEQIVERANKLWRFYEEKNPRKR